MKINILYYTLFLLFITTLTNAQEHPISTTTIQKIGQTELKVSIKQPIKRALTNNKMASTTNDNGNKTLMVLLK